MVQGNACIFRCTSAGQNESTVPTNPLTGKADRIEFDPGVIPDANSHLRATELKAAITLSENPNIKINKPNAMQDLGLQSLQFQFVGYVENAYAALASKTFLSWLQDFRKNASLPFGRFGIRYNNNPTWNTTPLATGGWMLQDYFERQPNAGMRTKLEFIATFRFTGDPTIIGT